MDDEFGTASRVLAAAEHLFAEKGLDDVNLREITARAKVNLASVNYHFGSKNGLQLALFNQVAARVNRGRRAELEAYLDSLKGERPELEPLITIFLSAYVGPGIEGQGVILARFTLKNRLKPIDGFGKVMQEHFDPWAKELVAALQQACPHLDEAEVYWRYQFMAATVSLSITERKKTSRILRLSNEKVDLANTARFKRALTRFLVSAFSK